jgi:hypothetical protein
VTPFTSPVERQTVADLVPVGVVGRVDQHPLPSGSLQASASSWENTEEMLARLP